MLPDEQNSVSPTRDALVIGQVLGTAPDDAAGPALSAALLDNFIRAAHELVDRLRQRDEEFARLIQITERVNHGVILEDILEFTYREMRQVIPYNRIGFALIDPRRGSVTAHWARSDRPLLLAGGFEAPLAGSTLQQVIETGRPRIINDLAAYLRDKPASGSTRLIVNEGMRSSLTCPLLVLGKPVGFIFFSSDQPGAYSRAHVVFFQQIAGQLAAIVEKGRLYTALSEQKQLIEEQNRVLTGEMEMARQVQRALMPRRPPEVPGLELASAYEPTLQVGGDLLDIVPLSGGRALCFVGDAMGHGVQAALVMSVLKTALHSAIEADPAPAAILGMVNRTLGELLTEQFVTAACCLIDPSAGRAHIALAGHPPPAVRGADGQVIQAGAGGLPLGVNADSTYDSLTIEFGPGASMVLYTDGLTEARNTRDEEYGGERLVSVVARAGGGRACALLAAIQADLAGHCGQRPKTDDLTLLVVKRLVS